MTASRRLRQLSKIRKSGSAADRKTANRERKMLLRGEIGSWAGATSKGDQRRKERAKIAQHRKRQREDRRNVAHG